MMLRKSILCLMSICPAAACVAVQAQDTGAVAHVLDVKGEWRVDGAASPVSAGQALKAGAKVAAALNRAGDAITIVRDEDMARQHVTCDSSPQNPCRNPIVISAVGGDEPSGITRVKGMVQAALGVLLSKPPEIGSHYAMTLSRGADQVRELEDVAALQSEGIGLPALPDDIPAGNYTLSIAHAGASAAPMERTARLSSEGTWPLVALDGPGLYEITITNGEQEKVADLMLLVVPPAELQQKRQDFEAAKARAAAWTGPSAESDSHLFLRAFLLAESKP
jgi:hypothetical protein